MDDENFDCLNGFGERERSDEHFEDFCKEVLAVMKDHDSRIGCEWKEMPMDILIEKFFEKVHDFEISDNPTKTMLDLSAYCYFVWYRKKYHWRF